MTEEGYICELSLNCAIFSPLILLYISKFLTGKIAHTPDIYLDELRDALQDQTGDGGLNL